MKNRYEVRGDVTVIFIDSRKYGEVETLVSTCDLEVANSFPLYWSLHRSNEKSALYCKGHIPDGRSSKVHLHRMIMNCPDGMVVDHINNNTLDNRRENLRICTQAENAQNRNGATKNSRTGIRNVYWGTQRNKWIARIQLNGKKKHIGSYETLEEAESAAIEARKKYMPYAN